MTSCVSSSGRPDDIIESNAVDASRALQSFEEKQILMRGAGERVKLSAGFAQNVTVNKIISPSSSVAHFSAPRSATHVAGVYRDSSPAFLMRRTTARALRHDSHAPHAAIAMLQSTTMARAARLPPLKPPPMRFRRGDVDFDASFDAFARVGRASTSTSASVRQSRC